MRSKFLMAFLLFFSFFTIVNADSILNKDWHLKQGESYKNAKPNSQTAKLSDGTYLSETLDENGLGVLRRISSNGKDIIWEVHNEYGYYYGLMYERNGYIYTTYYDPYYGTYLIRYDLDGEFVDEIQLTGIDDDYYVYDGEMYLRGNILYIINYEQYYNELYPKYIHVVNLEEDKLELQDTIYLHEIDEEKVEKEIDSISGGNATIITKNFEGKNVELANQNYFVTQQFNNGDYSYFVGYEKNANGTDINGFIYKLDKNGNIVWNKKSAIGMLYYDVTSLSEDYVAVSGYSFREDGFYDAYIMVYSKDGDILEQHNINDEIGSHSSDILSLQAFDNDIVAQVLSLNENGDYETYLVRYIEAKSVYKKVDGNGEIKSVDKAVPGETVVFEVIPDDGYVINKVVVRDSSGKEILVSGNSFVMPESDVTIEASFGIIKNPETFKELSFIFMLISVLIGGAMGKILIDFYYKVKKTSN